MSAFRRTARRRYGMNMMGTLLGTGLPWVRAVALPVAHAEESAIPSDTCAWARAVCDGIGQD